MDIHSHVLHGMDDGAKTFEDSLAMLHLAVESGTTDLVATPHANSSYRYDPEAILERLQVLTGAMQGSIRLYKGCDFHLSFDNIEDAIANPRKYTINGGPYLLVEFPDMMIFHNTGSIFGRLIDAGMIPVITHPERNSLLRQRLEKIAEWVTEGSYVQVTAGSLNGSFGKKAAQFARTLLDRELVHFIASDAHDLTYRPPSMKEAHAWLSKNFGDELADTLCIRNPRAALTGGPIEMPERESVGSTRKWYQLWR